MLSHAVQDLEEGVYIRHRLDSSLFDLRRLKATMRKLKTPIQEALFAPRTRMDRDVQLMLDKFSLTISLDKTKILPQAAPNRNTPEQTIFVGDTRLKNVDSF